MDTKNVRRLEKTLKKCEPILKQLEGKRFESVSFDEIKDEIKKFSKIFASTKGVEYTDFEAFPSFPQI